MRGTPNEAVKPLASSLGRSVLRICPMPSAGYFGARKK